MKTIIVIGGGASGLVSAIYASKNSKVILLEKNNIPGKKILLTGNGKCNYWNKSININNYNSQNIELIKDVLKDNNKQEITKLFNNLGIIPKIRDNYYYPYSNQATSIQTALIKECQISNIEIITNCEVTNIEKKDNKFKIKTSNKEFICDKVILSTGSLAYPKTGSTGDGYKFLKKLGHTITKPLPALVQLNANEKYLKEWHGIRTDVSVTLIEDNTEIKKEIGEIQLTDKGLSGICIFNLSSKASRGLYNNKKEQIKINFLHPINITNKKEFITWMNQRNTQIKQRTISDLLDGLLNYKLINLILKLSKIKRDTSWNNLTNSEKELLGENLTNFIVNITGTNTFDNSQTTTGGISLTEVNLNTMESLKCKDLYITGELLDIDGDCGGYNLAIAWITGMLAGKGVNND